MATVNVERIRALLRAAAIAGVADDVRAAAADELVDLLEIASLADTRRVKTLELGRRIQQLRDKGLARAAICTRLGGISIDAYHRAWAEWRDSRNPSMAESPRQLRKRNS